MEQAADKELNVQSKPRNAVIAFMLSLVFAGLGQVYNGQLKKGVFFFFLVLLFPFLFGFTRIATSFSGMITLLVVLTVFKLIAAVDAARWANYQKDYILKPYNTWYFHSLIAIGMYIVILFYDAGSILGIKTFSIPTPANNPTLQVGDLVVADNRAYQHKNPDYGDIVTFLVENGTIYTFRIVGLPNDEFELVDNIVRINGALSKTKVVQELTWENVPVSRIEEELPNGTKHFIYTLSKALQSPKANVPKSKIPADSYYLLGDFRDNAADSRFLGFIDRSRIQGRIVYSYWGKSLNRINIDFRDK